MDFIIGIIFISALGTLLHFTYDFSKHNKIIALFSAVNESTWEHTKMALTPTFLWSLYDIFVYFPNPNYFSAKLVGLLVIIIIIPLMFYGHKFIFKKSILIINIATFYIAVISSQISMKWILSLESFGYTINASSVILIMCLFGLYLLTTLMPINNFLFTDPITKKIGIKGHGDFHE